jgi:hypothetical protein
MGKHFSGSPGFRRSLAQSEIRRFWTCGRPHGSDLLLARDLGFRSNPNLHRAQKRPIQSADRSTETVEGVDQSFL